MVHFIIKIVNNGQSVINMQH